MKFEHIIEIPKKQRTKYISGLQLLLSLASGVAMISINRIYQYSQGNYTSLFMPLTLMILVKLIISVNYYIRCRRQAGSFLQHMSKISINELFIPSMVKTLLYLCWVIVILSIKQIPIVITIIFNLFLNEYLALRLKYSKKIDCFSILSCLLLSGSLICMIDELTLSWKIHTIILVFLLGTILPIAFFYLHKQVFKIYKPQVDQIIAKQHIVQIINYFIILAIAVLGAKQDLLNSLYTLLNCPVQLVICSITSFFYEYVLFQMLSKVYFKYIFLTQVSGIVWVAIYIAITQGISFKIYICMFLSILALLLILHIITIKTIDKFLIKLNRAQNQT